MWKSTPWQNGSERFFCAGASSPENGSERFFVPVNLRTVQNGSRTIAGFEQDRKERFRTVPCFLPQKDKNGSERFQMSCIQYTTFKRFFKNMPHTVI